MRVHRVHTSSGFTIIEAILAIMIITMIGTFGARLFLMNAQSSVGIQRMAKAASLQDMVFEQYTSYAAYNYFTLGGYNANQGSVKDFFKTSDNMGYDGYKITTHADYSATQSSCAIQLTLEWNEGSKSQSKVSSKTFTPQSILPAGADLHVQVNFMGNGLPGLTVTAPSVSGGNVTATTDAAGAALLRTVLPGVSVPVTIASALVDYNSPTGVSGYYTLKNGNYATTLSTSTDLEITRLNVWSVTEFHPARTIIGHLINDDDPIVVAGQHISLDGTTAPLVLQAGAFRKCGVDIAVCSVQSDTHGNYAFYNVISDNGALYADGTAGSDPVIPPGDIRFRQRYLNPTPTPYDLANASANVITADLHLRRAGVLQIAPMYGGSLLPAGTYIDVEIPASQRLNLDEYDVVERTDPSTKMLTLYNAVTSNDQRLMIQAQLFPPPGQGYSLVETWTCGGNCLGQSTTAILPMQPQFHWSAVVQDSNPTPHVDGMTLQLYWLLSDASEITASGLTFSGGKSEIDGLSPFASADYDGNPATPFDISEHINLSNPALMVPVNVTVQTLDNDTGLPAPNVQLSVQNPDWLKPFTDSNGRYVVTQLPYTVDFSIPMHCVAPTCAASSPIMIDTRQAIVNIGDPEQPGWAWTFNSDRWALISSSQPITVNLPITLIRYSVTGLVTDAITRAPVAGIVIQDGYTGESVATTGADGSYAGYFIVVGRSPGVLGHVSVTAAGSSTYPSLPTVSIPIPALPDPTIPLVQPFTYNVGLGGGA